MTRAAKPAILHAVRFGINLLLWTDDATDERHLPLYQRLKAIGFDGVELPVFDPVPELYERLGRRLEDIGLERTAISVRNAEDDPISPDPAVRRRALDNTRRVIDCCEAAGCRLLGGPLYAAIGCFSGSGPTDEEWQRSVELLREAADYAARAELTLALEFLNRFEIYLLNTASDAARFVRDVGRPNLGVHYDTFHAHIEEKDAVRAIESCAAELVHFHVAENDRGTPGSGQVRWQETFGALRRSGYDRWLTLEAFGQVLPSLAAATKIWRPLFDDPEKLASEGLAFARSTWESTAE